MQSIFDRSVLLFRAPLSQLSHRITCLRLRRRHPYHISCTYAPITQYHDVVAWEYNPPAATSGGVAVARRRRRRPIGAHGGRNIACQFLLLLLYFCFFSGPAARSSRGPTVKRRSDGVYFQFLQPHSKVSVSDEDDGSGGTCIAVLYCLRPPAPALGCLLSVRRTTLFVRGSGGRSSSLLIARMVRPYQFSAVLLPCPIFNLSHLTLLYRRLLLLTISLLLTMPGWPTLLWMPQFRSTSVLRGILRSPISQSIWRCGI